MTWWNIACDPPDQVRSVPLMRKLVSNLPPLEDGRVPVPTGPGLGITLDEDILQQFRVDYD